MDLARAIERVPLLDKRTEQARERMAAVWAGVEPDSLPIIIPGKVPVEFTTDLPKYNSKEAYYNPEKMLFNQLRGLYESAFSPGDNIPSIRADMGCGIFPTLLGVKNTVSEDVRPWILDHLSKETLSRLTLDDIDVHTGDFNRGLEYMAYFQEKLAGRAFVYTMDVQGPIDTAHQVYGDQFFYDLYDDPPFIHHLLELCTTAIIAGIKACKAINDEPLDHAYHYNGIYVS